MAVLQSGRAGIWGPSSTGAPVPASFPLPAHAFPALSSSPDLVLATYLAPASVPFRVVLVSRVELVSRVVSVSPDAYLGAFASPSGCSEGAFVVVRCAALLVGCTLAERVCGERKRALVLPCVCPLRIQPVTFPSF